MKKYLILIIGLLVLFTTSCAKGNPEDGFDKLRVGQSEAKVFKLMGQPDEIEEQTYTTEAFKFCYWFIGPKNQEQANQMYMRGIPAKYWCVILYSEDFKHFHIEAKEDIITGYWGQS